MGHDDFLELISLVASIITLCISCNPTIQQKLVNIFHHGRVHRSDKNLQKTIVLPQYAKAPTRQFPNKLAPKRNSSNFGRKKPVPCIASTAFNKLVKDSAIASPRDLDASRRAALHSRINSRRHRKSFAICKRPVRMARITRISA